MSGCFAHQSPPAPQSIRVRAEIRESRAMHRSSSSTVAGNRRPNFLGDNGHHRLIQRCRTPRAPGPAAPPLCPGKWRASDSRLHVVEPGTNPLPAPRGGDLSPGNIACSREPAQRPGGGEAHAQRTLDLPGRSPVGPVRKPALGGCQLTLQQQRKGHREQPPGCLSQVVGRQIGTGHVAAPAGTHPRGPEGRPRPPAPQDPRPLAHSPFPLGEGPQASPHASRRAHSRPMARSSPSQLRAVRLPVGAMSHVRTCSAPAQVPAL